MCLPLQACEDGNMGEVRRRPEVLPQAAQISRLPVRDRSLRLLFVPAGVGPVESETGGIRRSGLRPGHHSRRHPAAVPLRR